MTGTNHAHVEEIETLFVRYSSCWREMMQCGNFCRMAVRVLKKSLPLLLTVVAFLFTVKILRVLSDIDLNVLASVPSSIVNNYISHDGEFVMKYKSVGGSGSSAQHHIHRTKLLSTAVCPSTLFLLILVSTNVGNFDRRHLIRRTWGADYSIKTRWKTIFLLGKNQNVEEMEMAKQESKVYGDMVQADYYEHFWNMSYKVAMGFEWSVKYCTFSYLLKADDDVFVNTFELLDFLSKHTTPKQKLYTGNIMVGSVVLRDGRYGVSEEEYNGTVYKPYCSGGGYVLSRDVVKIFLNFFDVLKPLKIDDAYIGLLADRAGVKVTHNKDFRMYEDKCIYLQTTLVQHPARGECAIKLYNNMIKNVLGEPEW